MLDKVAPHNRIFILSNQIGLALRDPAMGLKMAPGATASESSTMPVAAKVDEPRVRKPAAKAVRPHALQIHEKSKRA
jgi:hypothetical protein